ncbi:MAG TPA: alpha/beta fold hydrolase [Propionicimonas sp.]|nr:alpha/beta fold hydrolase [Propionicimonas sp.]
MTAEKQATEQAWFRRLMPLRMVAPGRPQPKADRAGAMAGFAALAALDEAIPEATRSRLFEPDGDSIATVVIWHGFTNAPSQFRAVAEELQSGGYRVLVPRMPYHGEQDVLNRDLVKLTTGQLVDHLNAVVDIAAGFGDPVWAVGLSAGATIAGWAAATRVEVSRLVLAAPLVAPVGFPLPLVRLFVKFPRIVPRLYWWWDPRVKAKIVGSPHAYPGFPLPGIMSFLHLSEWLYDGSVKEGHDLERVVLVTNPGDFAIRKDAARAFASDIFAPRAAYFGEAGIDADLKWMHDFVDPLSPSTGTTQQVAAILLASLGKGEPTAGGTLVPPLVTQQP